MSRYAPYHVVWGSTWDDTRRRWGGWAILTASGQLVATVAHLDHVDAAIAHHERTTEPA